MIGRHAIVIGASSGIGLAVARRLKREGYRVSGLCRRAAPADAVDASFACDLFARGDLERAVADALRGQPAPEVLVYAAGHPTMGHTLEVPAEEARRAFEVNFWGLDTAVRLILPVMLERRKGNVIAISTIAALRSLPYEAYYGSSKAAVVRYLGSLDRETRASGVRLKCLGVGFVDTGFFQRGGWYGMTPPPVKGSGVQPDDVATETLGLIGEDRTWKLLGWRERIIALADRISPALYDGWTNRRTRSSASAATRPADEQEPKSEHRWPHLG